MGGQQSQGHRFLEEFNQQCVKVKDIKDLRYGEVQIYRTREDQLILVKNMWCNNEKEYNQLIAHGERRNKLVHPNLIKLLGYHSNSSNQLCGDFSKVTVYLEHYEYDLQKSIDTRRQTQQLFNETELWKIFYTIIKLYLFLDSRGLVLGDIRPSNIYLATDIKMAEYGIIPQDQSGFQRTYYNQEKAYLAPELLCFLNQQLTTFPPITQRSDIYSLGITLLECASLVSGATHYRGPSIDYQSINKALEQMKVAGYSQTWYRMIRELLKESPDERPSFQDINDVLSPFDKQILNMQPFQLITQQHLKPQMSIPTAIPQQQQYGQMAYSQFKQIPLPKQQLQQTASLPSQTASLGYQQQYVQPYTQQQLQQQIYPQQQLPPQTQSLPYQQPPNYQPQSNMPPQQPLQASSPQQYKQYQQHPTYEPAPIIMQSQLYQQLDFDQPEQEESGLNEMDKRIQRALMMTRDTELRNQMTPNYY